MLKSNLNDVIFSLEKFLTEFNNLRDIHAPFKYSISKNEKHNKLSIASGIATSIKKKYNLYKKLCRAKDPERKEELQKLDKAYKNHVTSLSRRSKESYFKNLFEEGKKNSYKFGRK